MSAETRCVAQWEPGILQAEPKVWDVGWDRGGEWGELDGGGRWPHVTDNGVCGTAGPSQEAQLLPHHKDGAGSRPRSSPDAPTCVGLTAAEDAGVPFTEERKPWSSGTPAR